MELDSSGKILKVSHVSLAADWSGKDAEALGVDYFAYGKGNAYDKVFGGSDVYVTAQVTVRKGLDWVFYNV